MHLSRVQSVGVTAAAAWLAAQPAAAVVLAPGDLLAVVAERQIVRVDPSSGAVDPISSGGLMTTVYGMALDPDGKLAVLGFSSLCSTNPSACGPHLLRIDPADGSQSDVSNIPSGVLVGYAVRAPARARGRTAVFLPNPDLHRVVAEVFADETGETTTATAASTSTAASSPASRPRCARCPTRSARASPTGRASRCTGAAGRAANWSRWRGRFRRGTRAGGAGSPRRPSRAH